MNVRRNLFITILSLLCFSCIYNNIDYLFDKLTSNTEVKELHFSCNLDSDMDEYYKRIIKQSKKITLILLELHTPKMLSIGFCHSMHAN